MAKKFFVPKFITIEDRLAGILTFRQLFALLGAFILSSFVFKINNLLGLVTALISFGSAFLFTFVYINGKPFLYILPRFFDFVFGSKKFAWQRVQKTTYKEIILPPEITGEVTLPQIKPKKKILGDKAEIILEYPETSIKEKINLSLQEPIALQAESINRFVHRHLLNPRNPYRLFPYVKLYKALK
jgi:hypothetical protein